MTFDILEICFNIENLVLDLCLQTKFGDKVWIRTCENHLDYVGML